MILQKYNQDTDLELQRKISEFEERETIEEPERKVRCNCCRKLFRGLEFIKKHFHNKHADLIAGIVKQRLETIKLSNYVADRDKLTNSITYASESFRVQERRRFTARPRRPEPEEMEGRRQRNIVDYSDI